MLLLYLCYVAADAWKKYLQCKDIMALLLCLVYIESAFASIYKNMILHARLT